MIDDPTGIYSPEWLSAALPIPFCDRVACQSYKKVSS